VNCFIATHAQDGGAENGLGLGIDDDLHEAIGFTFLDCPAYSRHRALADADSPPQGTRLRLGQTGATQRWIGEQPVAGDSIADPSRVAIEQVCRDNLKIVIGSVGKRSPAVAISERPDTGNIRAQLFIDHNVAAFVDGDSRALEPQIIRVRPSANGQQHVRTHYFSITGLTINFHGDRRVAQ
jgi:hypothetical protein